MKLTLTIPGRLPGLNEMIDEARSNKFKSAKQKKQYTELVACCCKVAKIPNMKRVNLDITWYEPHRQRDPDNTQAAVKYIWDGLVTAGVLSNDGWGQQGTVTHHMAVDKDMPRVEIAITEVVEKPFTPSKYTDSAY